ncbi:MAG: N-acetylglucosamine kinase, partial [Rubripirellula sp.]
MSWEASSAGPPKRPDLVLGIDGGGTKTIARIEAVAGIDGDIIGEGLSGPANAQVIGTEQALRNIALAIERAFDAGNLPWSTVAGTCFGLAGADRQQDCRAIQNWVDQRQLTPQCMITNDALPVLYAGTDQGIGVAMISGTGSLCFGRNAEGRTARSGGWGYRFGDEGSAYWIAIEALRVAARAADGRDPKTSLLRRVLRYFSIEEASGLITKVYSPKQNRAELAKLATIVFEEAVAGDEAANAILTRAEHELAELVMSVAKQLRLPSDAPLELAVTGGVLLNQPAIVRKLEGNLTERGYAVVVKTV